MIKAHYSKRGIVLFCTIAYFSSYFSRKTFSVVMANMIDINILEKDVAGLIGTALFVFYGLGQLISGVLGDRLPPKYLMFCGLMVSALCNFALPLMPNGYLMIPVWAVNGFAQALLWPPIVRILAENLSHEKYVTANLIVTCGAHFSTIVLYLYAPVCIAYMSYKAVFFTSSIACIVSGVIFLAAMAFVLPKSPELPLKTDTLPKKPEEVSSSNGVFSVLSKSGIFPILICIVAMGFLRDGIESWIPTLYMEAFNQSSESSILVSVIIPVFSILSLLFVRLIHKKQLFNNEAMGSMIIFALAAAVCIPIFFIINVNNPACRIISLILSALASACMHSANFLLISCVPGRFAKTGKTSTIGGICNACTYVGAAVSMYGIALVSEHFGWDKTVLLWIGICLLGAVFAFIAIKKYTSFLKQHHD